jgi:hypothetical protein
MAVTALIRRLVVVLVLGVPASSAAQPLYGSWVDREPPPREVSFSGARWALLNFEPARSVAVTYSRNLSDRFALEGSLDVASAKGGPFGMLAVQMRFSQTDRGPQFATLGYTYGIASRRNANAPRDGGFSVGGGLLVPFRRTTEAALRADAQLMVFRRSHAAIRLTLGVTVAVD